jgi:4-amino-4-deoxy-L-arabinose transferase-like glycosyltransferase
MGKIKGLFKEIVTNKYIYIFLGIIFIVGMCLRIYHFGDNIFFEIDQARDYRIIHTILEEGIGEFPLVGPKAGGTFFRLGPIFYIPPLISSWIFGLSVKSMALPEVIFSIATIPLFYLFVREFFSRRISSYITTILAVSLFTIEYAHFSWNPNSIPFFILLTFYALLKYSHTDVKNRLLWIVIMAFSISIAMQLHTITLIGIPIIFVAYFLITKIKSNWKDIFIFGAILFLFFMPLIGNDLLTHGENTKEFYKAMTNQQDSNVRTTIAKQSFMNVYNFTQFYTLITTSEQYVSSPIRLESSYGLYDLIDKNTSNNVLRNNIIRFISITIFVLFILMIFIKIFIQKKKKGYFDIHKKQYNFIILLIIWQAVFGLMFFPLALKVDSRYFLSVLFIPIIFIGFCFMLIEQYMKKYGKVVTIIIVAIIVIMNLYSSIKWLITIDKFLNNVNALQNEVVLEDYFIITNKQWQDIVNTIEKKFEKEDYSTVHVASSPLHIKPLLYLLQINKNINVQNIDREKIDNNGIYFYLREAKKVENNKKLPKGIMKDFIIIDEIDFGTVVLFQLQSYNDGVSVTYKEQTENDNRCYMHDIPLEQRSKCELKDIKHFLLNIK